MNAAEISGTFAERTETVREASAHKGLFYPLEIIVMVVLYLVGKIAMQFCGMFFMSAFRIDPEAPTGLMWQLLTMLPIAVIFVCFALFVQKRSFGGLGFALKRVHAGNEFGLGLLFGFVMYAVVIFAEVISGNIRFTGAGGLSVVPYLIGYLIAYLIQTVAEEIEWRGYFMVSVARRYPVYLAVITSAGLFGVSHLLNSGATPVSTINTALAGLLFCMIFIKRDSIWMAWAVHFSWNFAQSCIFGQSTSGSVIVPSVFKMTVPTGNNLISGGNYGVEASCISTLVYVIAIIVILFMPAKKPD